MQENVTVDEHNNIVLPLPLKVSPAPPANAGAVRARASRVLQQLSKRPDKLQACLTTMQKYIDKDHVEILPPDDPHDLNDRHFICLFPVVHPRKQKTRIVFDSAARLNGVSLNQCLLQGPDLNNLLLGVLLRFRNHSVAFSADVECMYHAFRVPSAQRKYLSFFWFRNNNPTEGIAIYQAKVHPFGNVSSPAVAIYGLRYAMQSPAGEQLSPSCLQAKAFVQRNFYVDDGLGCEPNEEQAIATLKSTISLLARHNIRLHKILSPNKRVMSAFPPSKVTKPVEAKELTEAGNQRTLGLCWQLTSDKRRLSCTWRHVP